MATFQHDYWTTLGDIWKVIYFQIWEPRVRCLHKYTRLLIIALTILVKEKWTFSCACNLSLVPILLYIRLIVKCPYVNPNGDLLHYSIHTTVDSLSPKWIWLFAVKGRLIYNCDQEFLKGCFCTKWLKSTCVAMLRQRLYFHHMSVWI